VFVLAFLQPRAKRAAFLRMTAPRDTLKRWLLSRLRPFDSQFDDQHGELGMRA
jgi:hypothetical protein